MVTGNGSQVRLCALDDVPSEAGRIIRAENRAIAVFRVGEEVFALDNVCPHWGGPIGEGVISVERMEVRCPWHRFRYDLRTGKNVVSDLRGAVTAYPIEIRDGEVFVTIGG
jgi:nitrite reductase (NADH) small subunit